MQLKQCCSRRAVVRLFLFPMQLNEVSWLVQLVQVQQTCSLQFSYPQKLATGITCTLKNLTICKSVFLSLDSSSCFYFQLGNLGISITAKLSGFVIYVSLRSLHSVSKTCTSLKFKEIFDSGLCDLHSMSEKL